MGVVVISMLRGLKFSNISKQKQLSVGRFIASTIRRVGCFQKEISISLLLGEHPAG